MADLGYLGCAADTRVERASDEATEKFWSRLYVCDRWSNSPNDRGATPSGAGMCVRRGVAEAYVRRLKSNSSGHALGRRGGQLLSSEDTDLALTSCDLGLGNGMFVALKLIHLIPEHRLEESLSSETRRGHGIFRYDAGLAPWRRSHLDPLVPSVCCTGMNCSGCHQENGGLTRRSAKAPKLRSRRLNASGRNPFGRA